MFWIGLIAGAIIGAFGWWILSAFVTIKGTDMSWNEFLDVWDLIAKCDKDDNSETFIWRNHKLISVTQLKEK